MQIAGWTWNAQGYGLTWKQVMERAKAVGLESIVIKWGRPDAEVAAAALNLTWGVENYVYPSRAVWEGNALADAVGAGAAFAVMNAEVEWESTSGQEVHQMCQAFRSRYPSTPLYACTDMRGNRREYPYHRAFADYIDAWLPMIYPQAFQLSVARAWETAFPGVTFLGKPVWPVIQTYDNVGPDVVRQQIDIAKQSGCARISIYTVEAATQDELAVVTEATVAEPDAVRILDDEALKIMAAARASSAQALKEVWEKLGGILWVAAGGK